MFSDDSDTYVPQLFPPKKVKKKKNEERPLMQIGRKKPYRVRLKQKDFPRAVIEAFIMSVKVFGIKISDIKKFILKHYLEPSNQLDMRILNVLKMAQNYGYVTENKGRYKICFLKSEKLLKDYYINIPKINRKRKARYRKYSIRNFFT